MRQCVLLQSPAILSAAVLLVAWRQHRLSREDEELKMRRSWTQELLEELDQNHKDQRSKEQVTL